MEKWKIEGEPYRYEGGADPSATVDFGLRFDLVYTESAGEKRKLNIESAFGAGMKDADARGEARRHLSSDDPPRRIVFGTDWQFHIDTDA